MHPVPPNETSASDGSGFAVTHCGVKQNNHMCRALNVEQKLQQFLWLESKSPLKMVGVCSHAIIVSVPAKTAPFYIALKHCWKIRPPLTIQITHGNASLTVPRFNSEWE